MGIKTTIEEHRFLVEAENDISEKGKTAKRCPRCGNEIVMEETGASYAIRCKSKDCIKAEFRGI